jgi:hypothetical protein
MCQFLCPNDEATVFFLSCSLSLEGLYIQGRGVLANDGCCEIFSSDGISDSIILLTVFFSPK